MPSNVCMWGSLYELQMPPPLVAWSWTLTCITDNRCSHNIQYQVAWSYYWLIVHWFFKHGPFLFECTSKFSLCQLSDGFCLSKEFRAWFVGVVWHTLCLQSVHNTPRKTHHLHTTFLYGHYFTFQRVWSVATQLVEYLTYWQSAKLFFDSKASFRILFLTLRETKVLTVYSQNTQQ